VYVYVQVRVRDNPLKYVYVEVYVDYACSDPVCGVADFPEKMEVS